MLFRTVQLFQFFIDIFVILEQRNRDAQVKNAPMQTHQKRVGERTRRSNLRSSRKEIKQLSLLVKYQKRRIQMYRQRTHRLKKKFGIDRPCKFDEKAKKLCSTADRRSIQKVISFLNMCRLISVFMLATLEQFLQPKFLTNKVSAVKQLKN